MIEAGTPFIKREGMAGVRAIANMAPGITVADMKVADGAEDEVQYGQTGRGTGDYRAWQFASGNAKAFHRNL